MTHGPLVIEIKLWDTFNPSFSFLPFYLKFDIKVLKLGLNLKHLTVLNDGFGILEHLSFIWRGRGCFIIISIKICNIIYELR